jgi:hypothetical protein
MKPCKFTFEGSPVFEGFAHGTKWNGLDNVSVTPAERDRIAAYFEEGGDRETAEDLRNYPLNEEGLLDLSGGYATTIMTKEREQFTEDMWDDLISKSPYWEEATEDDDVCFNLENKAQGLKLWCDYVLPEDRNEGASRFTLYPLDKEGNCVFDPILETEEWSEVLAHLDLQPTNTKTFG